MYSGSNVSRANFAKSIQESVPEFVKTGTILLKDNNHGTINMILKPENLGNVKLNLQVSDKVITGHITVASKEAYDAFKDCIQNLKQAFEAGGYDSAEFTLSFDMSHQGGQFSENSQAAEQMNRFFSEKTYSQYVSSEEAEPSAAVYYEAESSYRVSVVA